MSCSDSAPDVSFVVPARNEAGCVREAIVSVAAQQWPFERLEVVAVDNGSSDSTAEVLRTCEREFSGLAVRVVSEPAPGRGRAKNAGARAARGALLLFLDADSIAAPDLAQEVMRAWRRGYCAGSVRIVPDSKHLLDRFFFGLMEFGKVRFRIRAQMGYCERGLFLELGGFNEDLQLAEDRDLFERVERHGVATCHVSTSWIATSPRRLHRLPMHAAMIPTFGRWLLAHLGIGRRWPY